jgi:hypothetical protein
MVLSQVSNTLKLSTGLVKPSEKLDEIRSFVGEPDLEVVAAGKSAAIRLVVTQVDRFGSFEAQRTSILRALEAAQRLLTVGKELRNGI